MRDLGIDHLTALALEPATFATAAADAGFASISLRTIHIRGGEPEWSLAFDASLVARVRAVGIPVHAIEAVAITPELATDLHSLQPLLDQGAELGAQLLYAFCDDTDAARYADTFAALAQQARESGMRLVIEPMPYRAVATLDQAAAMCASAPGSGLIVDTLHASRGGTSPAGVAALDSNLLAVVQLCDAPATAPVAPSPSGLHPLLHEARFTRRVPGEGELPLAEYVAAMPSTALVTVEAPVVATGDPRDLLRAVFARTTDVLSAASAIGGAQ